MIKPPKLQPGDKIAAISVSSGYACAFKDRFEVGVRQARQKFNIEIIATPHAFESYEFLNLNPKVRADDLMQAFLDPEIKGIMPIIGGNDSILITKYIQPDIILNNPKILLGYSDTTCLHFYLHKLGIHSFYGPAVLTDMSENTGVFSYTADCMKLATFSEKPAGLIPCNREGWTTEFLDWFIPENQSVKRRLFASDGPICLQGKGRAQGRLIGGCVETLEMMKGTSLWPDAEKWNSSILFLETSELGMTSSIFGKCLRNYGMQGIFDKVSGILFGRPGGNMLKPEDFKAYDDVLNHVVGNEFSRPDLPILSRMDFGHTAPIITLPYGVLGEIDCDNATLKLLESGVS